MIPEPSPKPPADENRALEQLMLRVQSGDTSALSTIYDATCAVVHGVVVRILGNAAVAEEVTLDVFQRAWTRAADYQPARGTVYAWLLTVARGRAIDRLRSITRQRRETSIDDLVEPTDPKPTPDLQAELTDRHCRVRRAMQSLKPEQAQVIELAFFEGLSHGAIAKRLATPLGTIKARIRSGVRKLAEQIRPLEDSR